MNITSAHLYNVFHDPGDDTTRVRRFDVVDRAGTKFVWNGHSEVPARLLGDDEFVATPEEAIKKWRLNLVDCIDRTRTIQTSAERLLAIPDEQLLSELGD
jgi:triosephosphate isomerase